MPKKNKTTSTTKKKQIQSPSKQRGDLQSGSVRKENPSRLGEEHSWIREEER